MTREEEIEKAVYNYSKQLERRMNGIDYFKSIEILTHISLDDLKAVFKGFDYSNYALIHILPCGK